MQTLEGARRTAQWDLLRARASRVGYARVFRAASATGPAGARLTRSCLPCVCLPRTSTTTRLARARRTGRRSTCRGASTGACTADSRCTARPRARTGGTCRTGTGVVGAAGSDGASASARAVRGARTAAEIGIARAAARKNEQDDGRRPRKQIATHAFSPRGTTAAPWSSRKVGLAGIIPDTLVFDHGVAAPLG